VLSNIVVTFNRRDLLRQHLTALVHQTIGVGLFEVIVVDDGSSDGTWEMLQRLHLPYKLVTHRNDDAGYRLALSRNVGVSYASGDIFVFNDDDCTPEPACFEVYQSAVRPKVAIAGVEHHQIDTCDMRPEKPWLACIFTNAAVHRDDFFTAGRFDEDIPCYGWEDIDFAVRLAMNGVDLVQRKDAVVKHRNSPYAVSPKTPGQKRAEGEVAWEYLKEKYDAIGLDWERFVL
jgi:glycosyltransferase involved in cell wall biosynthesis